MNNLPKARLDSLIIQETDDELLIYDTGTDKAMCLNDTSQKVFQLCNGEMDFNQISEKTGLPIELVWLTIEELQKNKLLEYPVKTELPKDRVSRRKVLIKAGTAAVAMPLIASVVAPRSVEAQSSAMTCTGPPGSPSGTVLFGGALCNAPLSECNSVCGSQALTSCCSMSYVLVGPCPSCTCVCS